MMTRARNLLVALFAQVAVAAPASAQIPDAPSLLSALGFSQDEIQQVMKGQIVRNDAMKAASERVALAPQDAAAEVELARLSRAQGQSGLDVLARAFERLYAAGAKARILCEQIRFSLVAGKADAARALLEAGADLEGKEAEGWLLYAEGLIEERGGKPRVAKSAYVAATRNRPHFGEPRLAQLRVDPLPPAALLNRLTSLAKQVDLPAVEYESGALLDRDGAWLANFERLLAARPPAPPAEWLAELSPEERARAAGRWTEYGERMAAHRDFLRRQLSRGGLFKPPAPRE